MVVKSRKDFLFFNFPVLIFLYAVANGLIFSAGTLITYIIPPLFLAYAILINFRYNKFYYNTRLVYVFIIYYFILVFFSSNIVYSLKNVLKSFIPLFYFGTAIVFVNDYQDLNRLFRSMIILSYLFIANMIISNVLDLGGGKYAANETDYLQTGSIYSEGLNTMGYYLILVPAIFQTYPFKTPLRKILLIISSIAIFIILLLVLKRGAILIVLIGYTIMFYYSEFRQKSKLIKTALIFLMALLITYPFYEQILLSRLKVREDRLQVNSYETEGRFTENSIVIRDIILSGNPVWFLFGHDVMNSPGNYGGGIYGPRQIHNDYAQALNGSGVLGLSLYFLMNLSILFYYLKLKKRILILGLYGKAEKLLNSIFLAFFLAYFALALSGSIGSLLFSTIRFIFLGAIIGVFKNISNYQIHSQNIFVEKLK